ncbi:MAG: chloride channel protein [Bacteroidales bacterium]|jgi:CIC family chloride channel protein|nr:chloride channel protein [Bacteroidales bacterium]
MRLIVKIEVLFVFIRRFLKKKVGIKGIVLILSFFTGVFGAAAAILIKNLIHFTTSTLNSVFPESQSFYLYLLFPLIGIVLTILFVKYVVKDNLSHGVSIVLKSICKHNGKLRRHNTYSSIVASTITVGFGGSVGLEAPMVLTGSAIGSNLARIFKLNAKNSVLLLACGCTAAIAAIFKAPVAAIIFAIEVLMLDLTGAAILPLLIAAVTGTVMSIFFLGKGVMFNVPYMHIFIIRNIPIYILLGLLCGLVSVFFLRMMRLIEGAFAKIKYTYLKVLLGGLALGGLIFIFPVFYGEGYENINTLFEGRALELFTHSPLNQLFRVHLVFVFALAGIFLFKVVAMALTTGAGGVGGVFAPSLFVGAFVGYFVAEVCNSYLGLDLPYTNFVLAGMAGVMTAVMHAPLTAIFLIAELSGGYGLLIPLMITSLSSFLTVYPFEKYSVYTRKLAEQGDLKTHNKDKFALKKIDWKKLIDHDVLTIPIGTSLGDYTQYIARSKRNLFVVVDTHQRFGGLLVMDDHRDLIFRQEIYQSVVVNDLMIEPEMFIFDTDSGEDMLYKFNKTGNFNMPVITHDREYIGFLSKAKVLAAYKDVVAAESED